MDNEEQDEVFLEQSLLSQLSDAERTALGEILRTEGLTGDDALKGISPDRLDRLQRRIINSIHRVDLAVELVKFAVAGPKVFLALLTPLFTLGKRETKG